MADILAGSKDNPPPYLRELRAQEDALRGELGLLEGYVHRAINELTSLRAELHASQLDLQTLIEEELA